MLKIDSDALECDLAETYHIYDMRAYSPLRIAVFACGLRDTSRIKQRLSNQTFSLDTLLLAKAVDDLALLVWTKCKEGTPMPQSLVDILTGDVSVKESDTETFASIEDFERARALFLEGRDE